MIGVGDTVFVDTHVLLSATAPARPWHREALLVLEWPNQGVDLALSGQVVREYLVVATRPVDVNGLGLSSVNARANVTQFMSRMRLLEETARVLDVLLRLMRDRNLAGKQVHDANIVATAQCHGISHVVTDNGRHLRRLGIEVIELRKVA
jgi:predicted nucleic acid-binding protein